MANIRFVKNTKEYTSFLANKDRKFLGAGTEGVCAKGKDGKVYKTIYTIDHHFSSINDIITADMFDLESFCFPEYIVVNSNNLRVVGTCSKYINRNVFPSPNTEGEYKVNDDNEVNGLLLDETFFMKSYTKLISDVRILSEEGYFLEELYDNVLFNDTGFHVIDTCGYYKCNIDNEELFKKNILEINNAILHALEEYQKIKHTNLLNLCEIIKASEFIKTNYTRK